MKSVICSRCRERIGDAADVAGALELLRRHRAEQHAPVVEYQPNLLLHLAAGLAGGAAMSYRGTARGMVVLTLRLCYFRAMNPAPEGRP